MQAAIDIEALSTLLSCSVQTLYKTWKEYPHFYIGLGKTAKSARFIPGDVLAYLVDRDYTAVQKDATRRQKTKMLDRRGKKSFTGAGIRTPKTSPPVETPRQKTKCLSVQKDTDRLQTETRGGKVGKGSLGGRVDQGCVSQSIADILGSIDRISRSPQR